MSQRPPTGPCTYCLGQYEGTTRGIRSSLVPQDRRAEAASSRYRPLQRHVALKGAGPVS